MLVLISAYVSHWPPVSSTYRRLHLGPFLLLESSSHGRTPTFLRGQDKREMTNMVWYLIRRSSTTPIRKCLDMFVSARSKWRCRPLKIWIKAVRRDILDLKITNGLWEEHTAWRVKIHVTDPDNSWNELWWLLLLLLFINVSLLKSHIRDL